jgi:hypothetical protein
MQSSFNHSRAMSTHGDPFINRPMSAGPHFRSESRNFNPVGRGYPTGQRAQEFMQRRPCEYKTASHIRFVIVTNSLESLNPYLSLPRLMRVTVEGNFPGLPFLKPHSSYRPNLSSVVLNRLFPPRPMLFAFTVGVKSRGTSSPSSQS